MFEKSNGRCLARGSGSVVSPVIRCFAGEREEGVNLLREIFFFLSLLTSPRRLSALGKPIFARTNETRRFRENETLPSSSRRFPDLGLREASKGERIRRFVSDSRLADGPSKYVHVCVLHVYSVIYRFPLEVLFFVFVVFVIITLRRILPTD